jgi:hypothetical protein
MSEEEIESGIEEPLNPALENIARYIWRLVFYSHVEFTCMTASFH